MPQPSEFTPMLEVFKGAVWIAVWEAVKVASGAVLKRKTDKSDNTRHMVRGDLSLAIDRANECLEVARQYFTTDSDDESRRTLGHSIRHKMHVLSTNLNSTAVGLRKLGGDEVDVNLIVRFRQALTMHLDSAHWKKLDEDSTELNAMYRAGHLLALAVMKLKYEHC